MEGRVSNFQFSEDNFTHYSLNIRRFNAFYTFENSCQKNFEAREFAFLA